MPTRKFNFDASADLRSLLAEHFETWKRKNSGDFAELAYRCGVTSAYLSHVRRYGRIPSRPVLMLLALNFRIDGQKLFDAAGINDRFPYESGLEITRPAQRDNGFFSFRFDMDGFTDAIRSVVRSEVRQRSVKDILGNRPLRIGMNYHMFWMFGSKNPPSDGKHSGLFAEFAAMLGVALQKEVELVAVPFSQYIESLGSGKFDMFGPTMIVPNLPLNIFFTRPIFRLGVSALFRKREHRELPVLPEPRLEDLRDERYQIAVVQNSLMHLLANTRLKRSDATLILCASDEEAIERLTLRGVSRPAHVFLTNSMRALTSAKELSKDVSLLFATRNSLLDLHDVGIAVRPDWPEVLPVINDAIRFLYTRGGFPERLAKLYTGDSREVVDFE